ncbi:hypothetical protein WN943_012673 [Citrus x changshan-huyou]
MRATCRQGVVKCGDCGPLDEARVKVDRGPHENYEDEPGAYTFNDPTRKMKTKSN